MSLFFFTASCAEQAAAKYQLLLETAKFADRNGFTAVWTPERHFQVFGGLYGSPSVVGAALAVSTQRIQIRAGSVILPLQNPLRVAEEWSIVDNLSGGRVALAFASGWHVNDFVLAPTAYVRKHEEMYDKLTTVQRLWRGEAVRLPNGVGQNVDVAILPRPIQAELPIWLTSAGRSDQTFRRAGELGFNVLTANFTTRTKEDLVRKVNVYRTASRTHHGTDGHVTLMAHSFVGDSEESIRNIAGTAMERYIAANLNMQEAHDGGSQQDRGFSALSAHDREMIAKAQSHLNLHGPLSFAGTLDRCASQAKALASYGVDEIACLIDFGVPLPEVLDSLQRMVKLLP